MGRGPFAGGPVRYQRAFICPFSGSPARCIHLPSGSVGQRTPIKQMGPQAAVHTDVIASYSPLAPTSESRRGRGEEREAGVTQHRRELAEAQR